MGNPIIGSRQITDTNSGPVTFNRPDQTHSPITTARTAAVRRISGDLAGMIYAGRSFDAGSHSGSGLTARQNVLRRVSLVRL